MEKRIKIIKHMYPFLHVYNTVAPKTNSDPDLSLKSPFGVSPG